MKTYITLSLLGAFFLSMFSCSTENQHTKVGLLIHDYNAERWKKDETLFVEKVQELGGEVLVRNAKGQSSLQFAQAKELIEKGVKVLVVVASDGNEAAKIVNYAHENEVKVIAYDRLIRNANVDYYISFDNVKVGELQAEYLTRRMPEGKYVIFNGPASDNNSSLIRVGQLSILQPLIEKGDITITYDAFLHAWDEEEAFHMMDQLIEYKNLEMDAVLASSDRIARGVVKALKKHNLNKKVLVSGQDAAASACKDIISNDQTMTVYKPLAAIANAAALTAMKLSKDEPLDYINQSVNNGLIMVPAVLLSNMMVVHKQNLMLTVVADNFHSEEELYGAEGKLIAEKQE